MSTNYNDTEHQVATIKHHAITACVSTIGTGDMEMEKTALTDSPAGRLQYLLNVYGSIKPFLVGLTTLFIIPPAWRAGIKVFVGALDAVAVVAPQLGGEIVGIGDPQPVPVFKAGKDLDK